MCNVGIPQAAVQMHRSHASHHMLHVVSRSFYEHCVASTVWPCWACMSWRQNLHSTRSVALAHLKVHICKAASRPSLHALHDPTHRSRILLVWAQSHDISMAAGMLGPIFHSCMHWSKFDHSQVSRCYHTSPMLAHCFELCCFDA